MVVDEGALRDLTGHGTGLRFRPCVQRCSDSDTKTQPFTMPILTPTENDQTMSGRRRRVSVSVLGMVCWYVWGIRRIRRTPMSGHVEGLLTWEGTRGQILCQVVTGGRVLPDECSGEKF